MKASGIIRRVDQLGRIVLPMEMRKYMNIVEGTLLEMTVEDEGVIKLKKYSVLHNLKDVAMEILDSLPSGVEAIVLDEEKVITTTKNLSRFKGKSYNINFLKVEEGVVNAKLGDISIENYYLKKIIKDGDLRGAILIKCDKQDVKILLNIINNFIVNKI